MLNGMDSATIKLAHVRMHLCDNNKVSRNAHVVVPLSISVAITDSLIPVACRIAVSSLLLALFIDIRSAFAVVVGHPEAGAGGRSSASAGQFPHQASIIMDNTDSCGGSLITPAAVLTAAHCVSGYSTWDVVLGSLQLEGAEPGRVHITTRKAIVHPSYDPSTSSNDIAIIFLGIEVPVNSNIQLVNLPSRSQANNSFEGQSVTFSGWGRTSYDGDIPEILQYATMNVISNEACHDYYGDGIISSTLCATGRNRERACYGDSGGPMVIGSQGGYTLIGVVSFGPSEKCSVGAPSGFARVTSFQDWISSTAGVVIPRGLRLRRTSLSHGSNLNCSEL